MNNPKVNVVVGGHKNDYHSTYKTYILRGGVDFASQVIMPNTKYVVKHDFDLGGGAFDIDFTNADTHTVAEVTYYYIPFTADGSKYALMDDTLVFIDSEWNGLSAREIKPAKGTLFMIASITGGLHEKGYGINAVTVPENCILEFDGGSLDNGVIIGQDTVFINVGDVKIWGDNLTRLGTWKEHSGGGSLPDKPYDPKIHSGLGRKTLQLKDGSNILTQEDFDQENTIYIIGYDFDLDGETIEISEGCVLEFNGGSISNGTIEGSDTFIDNKFVSTKILNDVILGGTWKRNIVANSERIDYAQNRFRTLAHRGYPYSTHNRFAQDNSLAAIDEAGLQGFTGIECDPRRDVNGVIVLMHDADVRSVSNYVSSTPDDPNSYLIENLDYRTVFYKDKFGLGTNRHITTLAEAAAVCKAYNMFMFFDNKGVDGKGRSVSISNIEEIMNKMDYHNWGVFNYGEDYMASKSDYIIKGIEPKTTVEALREAAAKFRYLPNLWMRKYTPAKDNVPIEVLRECKKLGIKVAVNYTSQPGTEIDMDDDYISEAYQYYDFFLGDDHIMAGNRTTVGETEGGVIKCIDGNLPVPRLLQDEAVVVEGTTTYPYKDGLASFTYKDSLWALNHYFMSNPRLVTGYMAAPYVPTKMPELASMFPGGAAVLSTLMAPYRSITAYISGSIDVPRIVIQNIYNDATGNNEQISTYELIHDKNISEYISKYNAISYKNIISHSADIPAIGTNYSAGEWRASNGSFLSVVDVSISDIPKIKKGIRINNTGSEDVFAAYEIIPVPVGLYTLSFYVKGSNGFGVNIGSEEVFIASKAVNTQTYERVSFTFEVTPEMLYAGGGLVIRFVVSSGSDITFCAPQLQKECVLTDWIPKASDYPTSGTTANRPSNVEIGYMYFDTSLSPARPVYYAGNGNWVDASGTQA